MTVSTIPTQTSSEFYERVTEALTAGASSVSLTSEAFYAIVYELLADREDKEQAVEDLKEFLKELAHARTLLGIPFSELHLIEDDAIAASVTVGNSSFLITLPKEYAPDISITVNPENDSLEVDTDPSQDGVNEAPPEYWDKIDAVDLEREDLEQAVEDARTQLQWAEEALEDVEDDVELARDDLLKAKQALEDFNQE